MLFGAWKKSWGVAYRPQIRGNFGAGAPFGWRGPLSKIRISAMRRNRAILCQPTAAYVGSGLVPHYYLWHPRRTDTRHGGRHGGKTLWINRFFDQAPCRLLICFFDMDRFSPFFFRSLMCDVQSLSFENALTGVENTSCGENRREDFNWGQRGRPSKTDSGDFFQK